MTNVLTENWNDPSELAPHQLAFFYLSARVAKGDAENVKWSTTSFPASEVDTVIQAYFDVTQEHLHSNDEVQNYYDSKTDTYTFEAFGAPLAQKIVKADLLRTDKLVYSSMNKTYTTPAAVPIVGREVKLTEVIESGNTFELHFDLIVNNKTSSKIITLQKYKDRIQYLSYSWVEED